MGLFQKRTPQDVILTTCHPRAEGDRNYNVSYFIWEEGSSDVLKRGGGGIPLIAAPAMSKQSGSPCLARHCEERSDEAIHSRVFRHPFA